MTTVSVIIPSRNERFLAKTVRDLCAKARGDTEIIAVLEGYWPPNEEIVDDDRVHYLHFPKPRGMRAALNAGVALAKGDFVMKLDGHCMVSEGFDVALAGACGNDWVCVPTRHRLDPEGWTTISGRPPVNYLYLDNNGTLNGKLWDQKNRRRGLDEVEVDDLIICQGSCYFMLKAHWERMGLLDEELYGTFRKDPQEVFFKTWLSGGRCVRVKSAWYAHLHKGKKYGRGYGLAGSDWRKGDEFAKQWFFDRAWDGKQTKPFKWLVTERFPDMPGWVDWDTMVEIHRKALEAPGAAQGVEFPPQVARAKVRREPAQQESAMNHAIKPEKPPQPEQPLQPLQQPTTEAETLQKQDTEGKKPERKPRRLPRVYQYLEVDGEPFTRTATDRRGSRFWNEGKWDNFVAPLLPERGPDSVFVEMGCDAGLFLKMAVDAGFGHVLGVEKNNTPWRVARRWRDAIGYSDKYKVMKRKLGGEYGFPGTFDWDEMPLADVTLLSTFHYHVGIAAWYKYLDGLAAKTCYALVVSNRDVTRYHWRVNGSMGYLRKYFQGWEEVGMVDVGDVPAEGDPKPREGLFSVLFRSPTVRRVPIADIRTRTGRGTFGGEAIRRLTERVIAGDEIDVADTDLYRDWAKRKPHWKDKTLRWFVGGKLDTVRSIAEDWLRDPVLVQRDTLKLSDGGHRLVILKALGYESVIVREI